MSHYDFPISSSSVDVHHKVASAGLMDSTISRIILVYFSPWSSFQVAEPLVTRAVRACEFGVFLRSMIEIIV